MRNWMYAMVSRAPDPINSGDTKSWFEFYKMDAGVTCVPVDREDIKEGDVIWFLMDGKCVGGGEVSQVSYNIHIGKYEAYYDSSNLLSPDSMPVETMEGVR